MHRSAALVLALLLAAPSPTLSEPPSDIAYQGQLLAANGLPLPGPVNIQIRIYENAAPVGGEMALFVEDHFLVPLDGGVFTLLIGQGTPVSGVVDADLFSGPDRYLEMYINGERLEPRQAISSVPYALQAASLGGLSAAVVSIGILQPHLIDSAGQDLGLLLDAGFGDIPTVYNESVDALIAVDFDGNSFGPAVIYYDGSDCLGQGWVQSTGSNGFVSEILSQAPPGFPEPLVRSRSTPVRLSTNLYSSQLSSDGCENGSFPVAFVTPADPMSAALLDFTFPASVPLHVEMR